VTIWIRKYIDMYVVVFDMSVPLFQAILFPDEY